MSRLSGKVALITGGGAGIGRACALLFAREGARVAVAGRRVHPLDAVAKEIKASGGDALVVECDVTKRASVEAALENMTKHFRRLDIVVNNAGAVAVADAEKTTDADWDKVVATNLTGTFLVSRAALPALRKGGGGSIINVGSVLGIVGRKQRVAYCAAKAGVIGLTKAMALDHAHENIRVNCICPAIVETEMAMQSLSKAPDPESERRKRTSEIPLGRMGKPGDVAQMAVYLASDEASWITGVAYPLDGGLTAF